MKICGTAILCAVAFVACLTPAQAGTSFTNGNFASTSDASLANGTAINIYGSGSGSSNYTLTGWYDCTSAICPSGASTPNNGTNTLAYLYTYGSQADTINDSLGTFKLADSSAIPNTWTGAPCTGATPANNCGNYIAVDGSSSYDMALYQTLTGLTPNATYQLTFYWAAGQQASASGSTTEDWQVYFGSQTQSTTTVTNPSQGFTPWSLVTMNFTIGNTTSAILEFLAQGTPTADPPMDLLADVNLTQVSTPEPASIALFGVGVLGLALARRRWQKRA